MTDERAAQVPAAVWIDPNDFAELRTKEYAGLAHSWTLATAKWGRLTMPLYAALQQAAQGELSDKRIDAMVRAALKEHPPSNWEVLTFGSGPYSTNKVKYWVIELVRAVIAADRALRPQPAAQPVEQVQAALRELVRLKRLRDSLPPGGTWERVNHAKDSSECVMKEPAAWAAAFALVDALENRLPQQ